MDTRTRVRRYCCWIKNPLSKEGISSRKEWVDASDVVDAAIEYYRKTGAYPTDILSEDSAHMEERMMAQVHGYFNSPPNMLEQELAATKRKLEATEERVVSLQAQRDNFAHSMEVAVRENEVISNILFSKVATLMKVGMDAMESIARAYPDTITPVDNTMLDGEDGGGFDG